jgi:hypothetical protein
MTDRVRRTAKELAEIAKARAVIAMARANKVEGKKKGKRHRAAASMIETMIDEGDKEAKLVWDRMLARLKSDADRRAFDLDPLPKKVDEPAATPSKSELLAAAAERSKQANEVWKTDKSQAAKIEVGQALAAYEGLTGKISEGLPEKERANWGLTNVPGEFTSVLWAA